MDGDFDSVLNSAPGDRDRRVGLYSRVAPPMAGPGGWHVGRVVDGREIQNFEQKAYHRVQGTSSQDVWDGMYFVEVDPFTLTEIPGGASLDSEGKLRLVAGVHAWATFGADGSPAGPTGGNGTSPFHALKFNGYFRFRLRDGVKLSRTATPFEILADHHPFPYVPCTVKVVDGYAGTPPAADGSGGEDCTFVYDVYDLNGIQIGWSVTPEQPRYGTCEYHRPGEMSRGVGFWNAGFVEEQFTLTFVIEEYPVTDWSVNVTAVQVNTTTLKIQIKTRRELVLEQTDESDWTDVHTGNQCPA